MSKYRSRTSIEYDKTMERPTFVNSEVYHIYSRGVEKRNIFTSDKDRFRFVYDIFEFNDKAPALNTGYHLNLSKSDFNRLNRLRRPRESLVETLCFCLMPNHYHLLLRQKVENGITEFMRKLGTGYTNYFNAKYDRVGPLFQGKFKAVHVHKEPHLLYLPHYIHLNPLDMYMPEWRDRKVKNIRGALGFLESYRWSSYLDYAGKSNFPSVTQRDFILKMYGNSTSIDYCEEMQGWLNDFDLISLEGVTFEPLKKITEDYRSPTSIGVRNLIA